MTPPSNPPSSPRLSHTPAGHTAPEPDHAHAPAHKGFHGPKCWVLAAILGALVGWALTFVFPAQAKPPADAAHAASGHARVAVVQIEPDGTMLERLADQTTRPWVEDQPDAPDAPESPDAHAPEAGGSHGTSHAHAPVIPLILCLPFALLLASIAVMPFINLHFWHHHYPDFAFFLGSGVLVYYLVAFDSYGAHTMLHVGAEYFAFIALVGGLFVASGGILVDIRSRGTPRSNTLLLAAGAVLANIVGTTGASMLLIRPFLRMNEGRLRPLHVLFFIFIVSNCGGCLTPIGDPPLYLGFLKGVPFEWTLTHLWPMWLTTNGMLLVMFAVYDANSFKPSLHDGRERLFDPSHRSPLIVGRPALIVLLLIVACVFIDPLLKRFVPGPPLVGFPVGATIQVVLAFAAYFVSRPSIRHSNGFTFDPVKEVGFLFVGIFLTMAPALGYLEANSSKLGLESPTQYYFATGSLSALLDNAPTYASFLQAALGVLHIPLSPEGIETFIRCTFDIVHTGDGAEAVHVRFHGQTLLEAISLGAVFFGAMTYIGNGPNFMVKSIVDAAAAKDRQTGSGEGVQMPSFFGYLGWAMVILLPVLVLNWLIWVR